MISTIIDPNKNWQFHFGSLVKNETPIPMEEKAGIVSFYVPLNEKEGIKIELMTLKKEEQIIEGKYTMTPTGYNESVIFKIVKAGLFQGTPKGAMSRFTWTISTKS